MKKLLFILTTLLIPVSVLAEVWWAITRSIEPRDGEIKILTGVEIPESISIPAREFDNMSELHFETNEVPLDILVDEYILTSTWSDEYGDYSIGKSILWERKSYRFGYYKMLWDGILLDKAPPTTNLRYVRYTTYEDSGIPTTNKTQVFEIVEPENDNFAFIPFWSGFLDNLYMNKDEHICLAILEKEREEKWDYMWENYSCGDIAKDKDGNLYYLINLHDAHRQLSSVYVLFYTEKRKPIGEVKKNREDYMAELERKEKEFFYKFYKENKWSSKEAGKEEKKNITHYGIPIAWVLLLLIVMIGVIYWSKRDNEE